MDNTTSHRLRTACDFAAHTMSTAPRVRPAAVCADGARYSAPLATALAEVATRVSAIAIGRGRGSAPSIPVVSSQYPFASAGEASSNRSRFITLFQAATKSRTNFSFASSQA